MPDGTDAIPCLKCRKPFVSEGSHNRLCQRCNDANSKLSRMDLEVQDDSEARPRTWKYKRDR
jgi:hypothetical protein